MSGVPKQQLPRSREQPLVASQNGSRQYERGWRRTGARRGRSGGARHLPIATCCHHAWRQATADRRILCTTARGAASPATGLRSGHSAARRRQDSSLLPQQEWPQEASSLLQSLRGRCCHGAGSSAAPPGERRGWRRGCAPKLLAGARGEGGSRAARQHMTRLVARALGNQSQVLSQPESGAAASARAKSIK